MGKLSWATWLYIAAIVWAAAAILALVPRGSVGPGFWATCAALALLFLVCDSTPTMLGDRQWAWSPSSAATLAAVVLLGRHGGVGAAMVGSAAVFSVRRRVPLVERLFNGAMYAVAGYAAGTTFLALDDHFIPMRSLSDVLRGVHLSANVSNSFQMSLGPFAAAAMVHVLVNHGMLWEMLLLDRHGRTAPPQARPAWGLPLLLASDVGFAALGLVIAALWVVFGPFAGAIVLVPLFLPPWAMGHFAEHQTPHAPTLP